ncbi:ABC transporter permease subunit [Butyrivibrio sp. AE2032]|uniref:ABC transporter permease subunit n=1 Tax=Butyrivibrio sp. AE2032 TaxID=1458463 RepID=UPI0009DEC4B8|nr:sugar ABC transporter permease [Butyrivibrio sp. AE2032]
MGGNKVVTFLRKYMMLIATVIVVIIFYFLTGGRSLLPQNINNVISQNAYVFVLGTGMLLCILTGGNIDLSVGSVVCLAGGVGAIIMEANLPWPLAVIAMLLMGLLVGAWHGYWIAFIKVPPFIATLVGMLAFRGLANIIMKGYAYQISDKTFLNIFGGGDSCYIPDFLAGVGPATSFNKTCMCVAILIAVGYTVFTFINRTRLINQGYKVDSLISVIVKTVLIDAVVIWIGNKLANYKGIPTVLIWIALVLGVFAYITSKTTLGRNLYAVGGNEKATRLSGINTKMVMFSAYTFMGLLAGFAGVLNIARLMGSQPTYGLGYEMDAIAACFIGGASAYGGTGSIGGVIIGAALCGIINQGMVIANTPPNYQTVVKGLVLLIAVLFDVIMQMRRKGAKKTAATEAADKGGAKA